MSLDPSALSVASRTLRDYLSDTITPLAKSQIKMDFPRRAIESVDDDQQYVNLFFYRVIRDGYPSGGTTDDPLYVRIHCLITAIGADVTDDDLGTTITAGENDLRLMGEIMTGFHRVPVHNVQDDSGETITQMQVVPLNLSLDDINRLWSTQGDLPYRISVGYELALIPLPLESQVERSQRVGFLGATVGADSDIKELTEEGFDVETKSPVPSVTVVDTDKTLWVPVIALVAESGELVYTMSVQSSEDDIDLKVMVAGDSASDVTLVWDIWNEISGWEEEVESKVVNPFSVTLDPDDFDDAEAETVTIDAIETKGQVMVTAHRKVTLVTGETHVLKSNKLLLSVYEGDS